MSREKSSNNRFFLVVIIISTLLIVSLAKNAWELYQARYRLDKVKAEVEELELKKKSMEIQAAAQTDPSALDQAIRNKLNVSKAGETVVVISGELPEIASTSAKSKENRPAIYKQWLQVLSLIPSD